MGGMQYFLPPSTRGHFGILQSRLRQPEADFRVAGVACCELGWDFERILHPCQPLWVIQNAGGTVGEILDLEIPDELVLFSHIGCRFLGFTSVEEHFALQLGRLQRMPKWSAALQQSRLKLHFWILGDEHKLFVYDGSSGSWRRPYDYLTTGCPDLTQSA